MNINKMREDAKIAFDKANEILAAIQAEPAKATAERLAELKGHQAAFDNLNAAIGVADSMSVKGKDYLQAAGGVGGAAFQGFRQAAPDEGETRYDEKAWREVFIDTAFGKKSIRYHVPLGVEKKEYKPAFESYLRRGVNASGPNDRKTLQEGTDSAGGFMVPDDLQQQIIKKVAAQTYMRQLARVITTSRETAAWVKVNYTANNLYTSGVRLNWTGEIPVSSTTHRVTDPVFSQTTIPVHTAMASMPISNNLIEDSAFDIFGVAGESLSEAFSLGENEAFISGDGSSKPSGLLLGAGSTGLAAILSGTDAALTTTGDVHSGKRLLDLYYAVPSQYRRNDNCAWLMNSGTLNAVDNLVDGSKRPLIKDLNTASLGAAEPALLKNKRIFADEFMPDLAADAFPVVFGDFSGYMIVDRIGFSIQRYFEVYAELNMTLLLARKRVGGALVENYRLRALKTGD